MTVVDDCHASNLGLLGPYAKIRRERFFAAKEYNRMSAKDKSETKR